MRLIPKKEKLQTKQELQEKKPAWKKKSAKQSLKRNPTNIETKITAPPKASEPDSREPIWAECLFFERTQFTIER